MAGDLFGIEPPRSASLPDLSPSPAGTYAAADITVNAKGQVTAAEDGAGGGAVYAQQSIYPDTIAFSAELFIGPVTPQSFGYSYSSGGAGFLPWVPFSSTLTKIWFRTATALGVNATVRLRTSADVVLWSATLTAGQTQIVADVSLALAAGVKVQFSVEPASATPTLDHQEFGFLRSLS